VGCGGANYLTGRSDRKLGRGPPIALITYLRPVKKKTEFEEKGQCANINVVRKIITLQWLDEVRRKKVVLG